MAAAPAIGCGIVKARRVGARALLMAARRRRLVRPMVTLTAP